MKRSPFRVDRPLDTSEAIFHAFNARGSFLTVQLARVSGPLTPSLLECALRNVQERHPLLRARIHGAMAPRWVTVDGGAPPLRVADAATDPLACAEAELHTRYETDREPLWRCTLVPAASAPRGVHHLVLSIHHAVADGRSASRVFSDVLATCAALTSGGPVLDHLPPGPPLDDVMPRSTWWALVRHRALNLRRRLRRRESIVANHACADARRTAFVLRTVAPCDLDVLVAVARAEGATLTGALSAALVEASALVLDRGASLSIAHGVCLRSVAGGCIAPEQVGCFVGTILTRHQAGEARPFWNVARSASEMVRNPVAVETALAALRASRGRYRAISAEAERSAADPRTSGRSCTMSLSNRGRFLMESIAPFTLEAWHSLTSIHPVGGGLHLSCGTTRAGLSCSLMYAEPLISRVTVAAVLERFEAALLHASRGVRRRAAG